MKDLLKLVVCWFAFIAAMMVTGVVTNALHLQPLSGPPGDHTPMATQFLFQLVGGAVLVLGLYPLARNLAAPAPLRALALASFLFLVLGVNNTIEAKFFTNLFDGKVAAVIVYYAIQAILVGSALGFLFGAPAAKLSLPHHTAPAWAGRIFSAWFAWPFIYLAFGMCVAPFVVPYYTSGALGLRIPPMLTIFELQLFRSVVFLAISLPFIAMWKGSRRNLWLALGLTHAVVVGIYGLVGATFLPMVLRVAHSLEISGDSFAYAGLLVLLFTASAVPAAKPATVLQDPHPRPL